MYTASTLFVLAAAAVSSVTAATGQGWAVIASSGGDMVSCGKGQFCPAGTFCGAAKNSEVASCCPKADMVCVGEIEGAPTCADSAWTMYSGIDNNGFCCESTQIGVLNRQARTVNCVSDAGGLITAEVLQPGSGAPAPRVSSSSASASSSASSTSSASATASTSTSSISASSSSAISSSSSSRATTSASSTLIAPVTGTTNGTATTGSATSTATGINNGAANNGMAMGLIGAGLMVVAAL